MIARWGCSPLSSYTASCSIAQAASEPELPPEERCAPRPSTLRVARAIRESPAAPKPGSDSADG